MITKVIGALGSKTEDREESKTRQSKKPGGQKDKETRTQGSSSTGPWGTSRFPSQAETIKQIKPLTITQGGEFRRGNVPTLSNFPQCLPLKASLLGQENTTH